jgi:hypothetical protein
LPGLCPPRTGPVDLARPLGDVQQDRPQVLHHRQTDQGQQRVEDRDEAL